MKKANRTTHERPVRRGGRADRVPLGKILLELRNAIRRAERSRQTLYSLGFSLKRWQEIVKDVDPALRFMVRLQVMDALIVRLQSAGEPVSRERLVDELSEEGVDAPDRIRSAITTNLRNGRLVLHPDNKIGLPPWKRKKA